MIKQYKNFLLFLLSLMVSLTNISYAQTYTYTLNGNPINTTGWVLGGNATNPGTEINLNNNTPNQNGYIYYSTPQNLNSACDYFTIQFSYQIVTNPGIPPADGFAFWYIANPPSAFIQGSGIGMPNVMNGFGLIFDTYDNNSGTPVINANPVITLRQFNNNGYIEGNMQGLIGNELTAQTQITNGSWHTAKIEYNNGIMSVYLDGSTTAAISGPMVLANNTGYFGFSASTGAYYEYHKVKDVIISGGQTPDPVTVTNQSYCQFATATQLSAVGNLANPVYRWYTSPTGGTPNLTAPIPNTNAPGTYTWYVTQSNTGCPIESPRAAVTVTIHPKPSISIMPADTSRICQGTEVALTCSGADNVVWTPGQGLNTQNGLNVVATPTISSVYRAIGSSNYGCKDTAYKAIIVFPSDSNDIYVTIDEGDYYTHLGKRLYNPGIFKNRLLNNYGCDSIVTLHLEVSYKDKKISFPNAFTPNGDGRNDFFKPEINYPKLVTLEQFVIYNRWGNSVYDTRGGSANTGWDGTINGKPADVGIYYYYAVVKINEEITEYKGEVHLLR
ncbi:MAG TPA: gliding motility-associated C-terminal domain-containing protein [Edaphocola sp.]|nr:gliding motility-associated C-terminal domain-containing protein [Edaphocola sp.]